MCRISVPTPKFWSLSPSTYVCGLTNPFTTTAPLGALKEQERRGTVGGRADSFTAVNYRGVKSTEIVQEKAA